ncbi:MAG TPA: septal ring lytic transglycosylase RlpA family protein [Edaphobacter sp.]|nr:septal ring lytic transglycosylase RlpA family protein [Edaphobacter sp.]
MKTIPSKTRGMKATMMKGGVALVALALGLGAAASATDQAPAVKQQKKHISLRHWVQIGTASWYGRHFQGKTTANGESYNMYALTCAHRTLPMGSWIRVTNLKNHKSVFVRVNDRGPVPENRVVDLSYAAAHAVGIKGVAKVKLEPVNSSNPELTKELLAQINIPLLPVPGQ